MFFKKDLVLMREYVAFLILNVLDLCLTGWMFRNHAYEGNGIAAWVLLNLGSRVFALFKFVMVVFVILVCEAIATSDVRRARFVISVGCAVYFTVICYEAYLIKTQAPVFRTAQIQSVPIVQPICRLAPTPRHQPALHYRLNDAA